jgi:pimeloyl-ACP methyl ester carboxylesterase
VQFILTQTDAGKATGKVNIVAHSTGGLLTKKYIMDHPTDHGIGKAVLVGVPNLGAPKATKILLAGDSFNIPWLDSAEMQKISANMPVVYDLAPSLKYHAVAGSWVTVDDQLHGPRTKTDLDYNQVENLLVHDHSLNQSAWDQAEALHTSAFDNLDLRTYGVDAYNIVGCKSPTISHITERRYTGNVGLSVTQFDIDTPKTGDGSVPAASAINMPVDTDKQYFVLGPEHGTMLTADSTRPLITRLLTGNTAILLDSKKVTQDVSKCNLQGYYLKMHSPVDFTVTEQASGATALRQSDGTVLNSIPGSSYDVVGEQKFIFLPTDAGQTYHVGLQGTSSGTYSLDVFTIDNGEATNESSFTQLPVTSALKGELELANVPTLALDQDGNGSVDQTLAPSITLDQNQLKDVMPPVTVATLTGATGQAGWYRTSVSVNLSATDSAQAGATASGVFETKYQLDGGAWISYSAPFTVTDEGKHTVKFYSIDKLGNFETEQIKQFTIDKTPPEVQFVWSVASKDLVFTGLDQLDSAPLVQDGGQVVTAQDKAGNTTSLTFAQASRKTALRAELTGLSYNGISVPMQDNKLIYFWQVNKQGTLSALSQAVYSKKNYFVVATYDGKQTTLVSLDKVGVIAKKFLGLTLLKVQTSAGTLNWSY